MQAIFLDFSSSFSEPRVIMRSYLWAACLRVVDSKFIVFGALQPFSEKPPTISIAVIVSLNTCWRQLLSSGLNTFSKCLQLLLIERMVFTNLASNIILALM
uniref:Uncharacterized protein n=1 Tax=Cacopsylla melanoneura TaxID=428564 RepID=A0A8D8MA38_9HEMI